MSNYVKIVSFCSQYNKWTNKRRPIFNSPSASFAGGHIKFDSSSKANA